jgi:hypothetical protein
LVWVSVVVVLTGAGVVVSCVVVLVTGAGVVVSCVVVVVTGAGVVVACVVVVVLGVADLFSFTVVQAHSDARAAATRDGMISFFTGVIVDLMVALPRKITRSVNHNQWGVDLPP